MKAAAKSPNKAVLVLCFISLAATIYTLILPQGNIHGEYWSPYQKAAGIAKLIFEHWRFAKRSFRQVLIKTCFMPFNSEEEENSWPQPSPRSFDRSISWTSGQVHPLHRKAGYSRARPLLSSAQFYRSRMGFGRNLAF